MSQCYGPAGSCICLKCGHREPHKEGVQCRAARCPSCGAVMIREGSVHHRAFLDRQKRRPEPAKPPSA
jgi:hypothetical protein